ncbi:LysE/ArgO family amino acid transporter [Cohnella sp. AR92]|uniref:LysE/ArgO family amino acid transporter n=1 Tax=Cohnella sp. AR92 TaxID=648716 RepID=UPI000F8F7A53|nr:LysE family transporter [Cohnella sp. AR92]RUS46235.1 amino acid transporter [Cohnella sp. AR92]
MTAAFLHGIVLSLGLILPLGVQNYFIFSQGALSPRYAAVIPVAAAAAVCDTLLIALAVSGVSLLVLGLSWMKTLLLVFGVLFLLYMGWIGWRAKPAAPSEKDSQRGQSRRKRIGYTLMVSLLNPHAILDTVGVIGTSSLSYEGAEKLVFALACVIVSWLWFFGLAAIGRLIGSQDRSGRFLGALNKLSALVMWAAAVYLLWSF